MDPNTGAGTPQQTTAPKRERQRKWDVPSLAALQEDPLERAKKMAEEIAMQLAAKTPQTPAAPTVIVREIDINDSRSRTILTKGATQQEIQRQSGASVITRGRYKPPGDTSNSTERPLYLHVSSEKEEAVLKAVEIIERYMQQGNTSSYPSSQQYNRPSNNHQSTTYSAVPPVYAANPTYPAPPLQGHSFHSTPDQPLKIYIGIDADPSFNLMYRLQGPDSSYLTHIQNEAKVSVEIKGRGTGKDEDEPMHFSITAPHPSHSASAKNLCESLLSSVWTAFQAHRSQMAHQPPTPSPHAPPGYPPGYQTIPPPPPPGYPPGYTPPHSNMPGYPHHPNHPHSASYPHPPSYPPGYAPGYPHPHMQPHTAPHTHHHVPGYGSIPPPPSGPPPPNLPPGYIVPPPVAPPQSLPSGRTSLSAVPPPPSYFQASSESDPAGKPKNEATEDDATPEIHIVPPPPVMPRLPSSVKAEIPTPSLGNQLSSKSTTTNPLDKVLQDQKSGEFTTPKRVIIPILSKPTPNSQDRGPKKSVRFSPHNEIFIIEARNTEPQGADGLKLVDYGEEEGDHGEDHEEDQPDEETMRPVKRLFSSSSTHSSDTETHSRGKTSAVGLLSHYHQDTDEYDDDSPPAKKQTGAKPFWAAFNE